MGFLAIGAAAAADSGTAMTASLFGALAALALQFGDTPVTAIGIAAALELCAIGTVWVTEASAPRTIRDLASEPLVAGARAPAMQMA
jgi:hypothetical protein